METPAGQTTEKAREKKNRNKSRLGEILGVLYRNDIVKGMTPERLRKILEDLGSTFVKLGQIMSMRADILPKEYCLELQKLRANVRPMEFEEVRQIVEAELHSPLEEIFSEFGEEALGSASIAQVHRAALLDGSRVVVKVQRPNIHDIMFRDITLLRKASGIIKLAANTGNTVDFNMLLDEMWTVSQEEMNFLAEARNADEFASNNRGVAYVKVPAIYHRYTTGKVLVMEYVGGYQIDEVDQLKAEGYDLNEICNKFCESYIKQIIDDGFFHADPHPGNVHIEDGKIVWLDLGMMGRLSEGDRRLMKKGVQALADNDAGAFKEVVLAIGESTGPINHAKLYEDIDAMMNKYVTRDMADFDLAKLMDEFISLAKENHIAMPRGMTMFSRGLLTIQGVVTLLNPEANITQIMEQHIAGRMFADIDWKGELKKTGRALLDSSQKSTAIPAQISDLLKQVSKGRVKLNLVVTGSEEPIHLLDRIMNKLVIALVISALLISSSLICLSDMQGRLFGIPALGVIGYAIALILSVAVIVVYCRGKKKKKK